MYYDPSALVGAGLPLGGGRPDLGLPGGHLAAASGLATSRSELQRLKVNGLPSGSFTDARLRQLFSICGQVRARSRGGSGSGGC